MINQQVWAITGMYPSISIFHLLYEVGLIPALIIRQSLTWLHLLFIKHPDMHPAKELLPVSLRKGDQDFQPSEILENSLVWTKNSKPNLFGYY